MKKAKILSLSLLLIILSISCVNAGFLDGFFGGDTENPTANTNKFIDIGTSKNSSSDWFILQNVSKTINENGTTISSKGDSGMYANKPTTSINWKDTFEWSTPFTIEFDVLNWEGAPSIRITDNTNDGTKGFEQLGIQNGSHVKIVSDDTKINYIVNNKTTATLNKTFKDAQIGFRLIDSTIEYKNFKIY